MSSTEASRLPYWHVNVAVEERKEICPDFLLEISDRNKEIILKPADDYHYLTWEEVKNLIETNRIDEFRRAPLDHRRYLDYTYKLKREHGNVQHYMQHHRLGWEDLTPNGAPFNDMKTVYNDWPYGIDSRIIHLCVWTKFALPDDPEKELKSVTPECSKLINDYVDAKFRKRVPAEHVTWFKNWVSLKSINSMEHFHVLLFDPDKEFVEEVTNGDVPRCKMVWNKEESKPEFVKGSDVV